jgi:hypothetical protein
MRFLLLSVLALTTSGCAHFTHKTPSFNANAGVASAYVFRGVVQNERAVLQTDATVALSGAADDVLSGTVWANMDLSNRTGDAVFAGGQGGEFTEIDFVLDYARSFGSVATSVGVTNYNFPGVDVTSTTEVYAGAALETLLAPSLTAFYDVDEIEGLYLSAGVGHGIGLSERLSLDLAATLGWASSRQGAAYWGSDSSGITDAMVSAALGFSLDAHTSLTLSASQWVLFGDAKDAVDAAGIDTSPIVVALAIGFSL